MIEEPHTYSEWTDVLKIFKEKSNDEEILKAMQKGTLDWQSGVAERFAKRLVEAVNSRLNGATEKFQTEMKRSNGQEGAVVQALLSLRKELSFLLKAVDLSVIPEKDRKQYCDMVTEQMDNIQKSLEDSAKKDRTGKMSSIVRNHRVNCL